MIFIDTNYFLRLLDDDKSDLHRQAADFFMKASSTSGAYMTSTLVIFEVYWVLRSFYHQDKTHLISLIGSILKMDCIVLADRLMLLHALTRFSQSNLEFEDCFHIEVAKMAHCRAIVTFDIKLARAFNE